MIRIKKEVDKILKLQKIAAITGELKEVEESIKARKKDINRKGASFMAVYAATQHLEDLTKKKKQLLEELIKDV